MSQTEDPVFETAGEHESVTLLREVIRRIEEAKPFPLSSSVRIEPAEVLDLLEEAMDRLPEEIRQARWLLKEREDFLAKVQREGDDILDAARAHAERMVSKQEVVRQAKTEAQRVKEAAEADARRLRHEAEDYVDQHLAKFEIVLDRVTKTVAAGRAKLQVVTLPDAAPGDIDHIEGEGEGGFFDQELTVE